MKSVLVALVALIQLFTVTVFADQLSAEQARNHYRVRGLISVYSLYCERGPQEQGWRQDEQLGTDINAALLRWNNVGRDALRVSRGQFDHQEFYEREFFRVERQLGTASVEVRAGFCARQHDGIHGLLEMDEAQYRTFLQNDLSSIGTL
ncbi:MAG: hypothetical protein K0R29_575 [Pseudobdellovibrio sp.]|jgi:hypothetical protein|nr:hypothetical protein [Pseudobdellovibrio sp.]